MKPTAAGATLLALLASAAVVFTLGIGWGLPSRATDRYLLGADYHGLPLERLTSQVPEVDAQRGADVVAPDGSPGEIVHLNDTDAKRAQILCRYRLYSYQPDEMITFRALSLMKPRSGDFDPRLYQYGGLWIYPVGALIEAGNALGMLQITDRANYIGNPELFGKLYVVARLYSAAWGVAGLWAVFVMLRRMTGGVVFAAIGAFCFLSMPVVVNAAHEGKPHLAGLTLVLLAVLAAENWVRSGERRWAWISGALCGAAAGMVLWGVVAIVVIPAMGFLRPGRFGPRLAAKFSALIAAVGIYAPTNPYVIYHLLRDPAVLSSNLGNTAAMYHAGSAIAGLLNGIKLASLGMGSLAFVICAMICVGRIAIWITRPSRRSGIILFSVALVAAIQFMATAAGKPGEYGRFALLPDVAMLIAAMTFLARRPATRGWLAVVIAMSTATCGSYYVSGFIRDSSDLSSRTRWIEAAHLQSILEARQKGMTRRPVLGVYADPAPYSLPPVDLDGWDIVRYPRGFDMQDRLSVPDVIVEPDQSVSWLDLRRTSISWAGTHFIVIENSVDSRNSDRIK